MIIRCREHRLLDVRLLQVERDEGLGLLVQRTITYNKQTCLYVQGAWALAPEDLVIGVYCEHCLKEGRHQPLDLDEAEYNILGRAAHYFPPAEEMDIDMVWPYVHRRFQRQIVHWRDTNGRAGIYDWPKSRLPEPLERLLNTRFKKGLYRHQALAIDAILGGEDVVIATPTASGKSLCYVLPILATLLQEPAATAIYLAPTQALAEDQFDQWLSLSERKKDYTATARERPEWHFLRQVFLGQAPPICIARYDGGTDTDTLGEVSKAQVRQRIRGHEPRVVITTPEMLHSAILTHPHYWTKLLRGLRFVVVDEMHCYKGLFGASMAQVLRRLLRHCHQVGSEPQFIGCSATIRNPDELGRALMGRTPRVIEKDGAPRRRRRFVIMDSARAEEPVHATARNLMVELVRRRRLRSILFTRSISEVDQVYNRLQDALREHAMDHLVSPYKAILPGHAKKAIAAALKSGRRAGVVTTNALELGVDIGELSAAVLVKFPGSMSSLFQQSGRVGRRGEGLIFLLADANPLNQFFVQHPDEFLALKPEEVYIDPDHRYVVEDHLVCAAREHPLNPEIDQRYFGPNLPALISELIAAKRLKPDDMGGFVPTDPEFFAGKVGLRNRDFFQVPICHMGTELTRESSDRAARTLHRFARIQLENALYEVGSLHLNWKEKAGRAEVRLVNDRNYVTAPFVKGSSSVLAVAEEREDGSLSLGRGTIQFLQEVLGYYRLPMGPRAREEERSFQQLGVNAPPARQMQTQAAWVTLPGDVVRGIPTERLTPMLRSMQKALALAACIHLRCDSGDLDGVEMPEQCQIFLYDTQAGGSGLAAKVYQHFPAVWEMARRLLAECEFCSAHPESRGCPKCVTDEFGLEDSIDRHGALELFGLTAYTAQPGEAVPG